jgi:hypothetical protein
MKPIEDNIKNTCQNCGANLYGNYCSNCGQKSSAIYEKSLKNILQHFIEELITWDSKFLQSLKYLFFKPGYLTHEYVSGRIVRYISPVKLFLFTSFVLFLIMIKSDPNQYEPLTSGDESENIFRNFILEQENKSEKSKEMYIESFNNYFNDNITLYIFFIMFLFSLILKIVYIPKNYFYSEHIVFTLHFFTFVLWVFFVSIVLQDLGGEVVLFFIYIIPSVYLFFAIKRVYHKSSWKALITASFFSFTYGILITIWILGTIYLSAVLAI